MKHIWGIVAVCLLSLSANADLLSRAGGQAYYDTVLHITWLTDANRAGSTDYGPNGYLGSGGVLNPVQAQDFLAVLNATPGYLGATNWRLPFVVDTESPGCPSQNVDLYSGHDCLYNVKTTDGSTVYSEFASLYYDTLNNDGYFMPDMSVSPSCSNDDEGCRDHSAPFVNIVSSGVYWTGTPFAPAPGSYWFFDFKFGKQNGSNPGTSGIWVVRDGDIGDVPFNDADGDGILDAVDNCKLVANPAQLDANHDGYGNICDGDLNNSGLVTAQDNTLLRNVLNQNASASPTAAAADLNGSGLVTSQDNTILRNRLNTAPGPSGLACAGTIPCP